MSSDANMVIRGQDAWSCQLNRHRVSGPQALSWQDAPAVRDIYSEFDDINDQSALVNKWRAHRRHNALAVLSKGCLPFGAEIQVSHLHRYAEGFVRVMSDIVFPRGSVLRQGFSLGTIELGQQWRRIRTLELSGETLAWGAWQDLSDSESMTWAPIPVAIALQDEHHWQLEVGTGNDLWRWRNGLTGDGEQGTCQLTPTMDGWQLRRSLLNTAEAYEPRPRTYRFSWYMAWSTDNAPSPSPAPHTLPFSDRGEVDTHRLRSLYSATLEGDHILFDVSKLPVPEALQRPGGHPCFAASGTIKRLKRIVRQLSALAPPHPLCLQFHGLKPGVCRNGHHLDRSGERLHWDISAIQEFSLWAENALPENWSIAPSSDAQCPHERTLFRPLKAQEFEL